MDKIILDEFSWLFKSSLPRFGVNGNKIKILDDPLKFYNKMLYEIEKCEKRITLASLYIGNNKLEQKLLDAISNTISKRQINVKILLDATRTFRLEDNFRKTFLPLLRRHTPFLSIALYKSIDIRGFWKLIPQKINEIVGLQHMKIYVFDNNVILSGANLSHDYFTNRQDRYVLIQDVKEFADFLTDLVNAVVKISLQLTKEGNLEPHSEFIISPINGNYELFIQNAAYIVNDVLKQAATRKSINHNFDTWLFPCVQMNPFYITHDFETTLNIFSHAQQNSTILLSTSYFNPTEEYKQEILKSDYSMKMLISHPKANGFYNAKGIIGNIPSIYVELFKKFFHESKSSLSSLHFYEYFRPSWTFHAKGLWYYIPGQILPCFSLIGSSNFGYRSVYRDLELQVALITCNQSLREELHNEQNKLFHYSCLITEKTLNDDDHKVPLWLNIFSRLIKSFF